MTIAPNVHQRFRRNGGGLIDRSSTLSFQFDGREYHGFKGDTLASALLAEGVRLVGRSFKYHRPRGIFGAGPEEPNALVELRNGARREPNSKATTVELFDGLTAQSQNRWPSLWFDLLSINQAFAPFLVSGFYYKTFMWPASFWERVYEPLIRRAAGLGRISELPDPDRYERTTAFCDVLVIGAGAAGLTAALMAGRAGLRVILCDEDFQLGGRLLAETYVIDGQSASDYVSAVEAELDSLPNVRVLKRTQVFGAYDSGVFGGLERVSDHYPEPLPGLPRQRFWRFIATRCINAMGAVERPIAFGGNDRPGVMLASAIRTYANRFAVLPGRSFAIFTSSDDGWRTAADLIQYGAHVEAVVDVRATVSEKISDPIRTKGIRAILGGEVFKVEGGKAGVTGALIRYGSKEIRVDIDCLGVSGGWNPQIGLTTHKGAKPKWSNEIAAFVPDKLPQGMFVAGAADGHFSLTNCFASGEKTATRTIEELGFTASSWDAPKVDEESTNLCAFWQVNASEQPAFVDLQNDVTTKDIEISYREGFRAVEHLKRYTTLGMATDQGRTSGVVGHAIMASLCQSEISKIGTTVSRPPHNPVALSAFAGHSRGKHFRPTRHTACHDWHVRNGGEPIEVGQWLRPQWFRKEGEHDWMECVTREVKSTRSMVGVCDVSTLGKIDLKGPDVGRLLDRVYVNMLSTLPVGKTRYGVMLREDGFVFDDGTTARLSENHYVMSTTTANASRVMQHLEFCHQALWPEFRVAMASVTEQWSQFAIAGPQSRALLQKIFGGLIDLSNGAFPFMGCREVKLEGIPTRIFRISFSGEMAYEVSIPARFAMSFLEVVMRAGSEFGAVPYGTEALGVMRIEKGHVAGAELNGQTTLSDIGLGRMASTKKDFIGRVLSLRPALRDPNREALVGIRPLEPAKRLRAGAHLVSGEGGRSINNDQGHLTSVAYSPTVASWIALGFIKGGSQRIGERLRAYDPIRGEDIQVELVSPVFVDPEGSRLHA